MSKQKEKKFFCSVVSEEVRIALKTRPSLKQQTGEIYVQCDQNECQYADENVPPCPLTLNLFAEEIEEKEERRNAQKEEGYY